MVIKEKNTKRILISFTLVIGMIVVATVIAVAAFFMSIPVKHNGGRTNDIIATRSPDLSTTPIPENKIDQPVGSKSRDPFLPPSEAWPNLKPAPSESPKMNVSRTSGGKASPTITLKKVKTTPGKKTVVSTIASTSSPETHDPNSPEYKEPLILPGMSNANGKNTDIGLKVNYKVKKSDTIYRISQKFGVTKESILRENGFNSADDHLTEGKILIIPIPKNHLYQTKASDTLWSIANRCGITVELLKDINNISGTSKLGPGKTIILPIPVDKKQHP